MNILITGSSGLIGSELVKFFVENNHSVFGIDCNMRETFFGHEGDTSWNTKRLLNQYEKFIHFNIDIRDRVELEKLFKKHHFDAIIHAAAQPSHDLAAKIPFLDFEVNAVGTLNLLQFSRLFNPDLIFIYLSTNKVYGDTPNQIQMKEMESRWDYDDPSYLNGIRENLNIDQCKHSLFGVSKLSADIMVQEYGRYFGMKTVCLRGGCLTGPNHSGVELHGFLSYLIKCNLTHKHYTIYGYKGKQVRDNIHAKDVALFCNEFIKNPKSSAVYNIGGGKNNSISILECFDLVKSKTGIQMLYSYIDEPRSGDHICYYSDLSSIKNDYPNWEITYSLDMIFDEIIESWAQRI